MSDSSKRHTNSTHPDVTLDQFFDTSIGLLCITDKAGRFVKLNDEWTRVLGYELAELEGQACVQFIHPDDRQSSQRKTAALLAHNEIGTYTNRYRAKDGSFRWIQWRLQPYGEFVFAIARDVTSRKKTETELLESFAQQDLISQIAQLFAGSEDFDNQADTALAKIGENLQVSRVYIFVDSEDRTFMRNTHEWCNAGIEPQIDALQAVTYAMMPSWRPLLQQKETVISNDIATLPQDVYDVLRPQGIKAVIVHAMNIDGQLGGFIGFDECLRQRDWTVAEIRLLRTVCGIISNAYTRHLSTQRLEQSKERLANILYGTNAGTWEWNVQTGENLINERWAAICGYTKAELDPVTADTFNSLVHPEDVPRTDQMLARHLEDKTYSYDAEFRMRHKGGHWVWVHSRGKLVERDAQGNPLRMFGTHTDITTRKLTQMRLEERENILDLFFRQSLDGFFFMMLDEPVDWNAAADKEAILDYAFAHQRITRINQAMLDQYRAAETDFLGSTPADLFAHDLEHGRSQWRILFESGNLHIDSEERRFDGTEMFVEGDYICIYDEQGLIRGHFGVQRDVTEVQETRLEIEEANRFNTLLLDSAPIGIVVFGADGKPVMANPSALEIIGAPNREALMQYSYRTAASWKQGGFLEAAEDAVRTQAIQRRRSNVTSTFGRDVWLDMVFVPIDGHRQGRLMVLTQDVTEEMHARRALEASEQRFRDLAIRDGLTNVYNRRYALDLLARALDKSRRDDRVSSVCIIDVDHFKLVNDRYGHLAGDFVLFEFCRMVQGVIRDYDVLGRYGGEEFILIIDDLDRYQARERIEALLSQVRDYPFVFEDQAITITFSAGVSDTTEIGLARLTVEGIIALADERLYSAKEQGRNQVC